MTLPLPSYVKTGTVAGKSIVVGVDTSADVDTDPDATYPEGSVLDFYPSVPILVFTTDHASVYLQQIRAVIDASGDPVTPDGDLLKLVANVGQPDNDQDWFWQVRPTINNKVYQLFRMDVAADATNYLSDWQPIPAATPSSMVARGPAGPGAPPPGTPDGYIATSQDDTTVWAAGGGGGGTPTVVDNGTYVTMTVSP